MTDRRMKKMLIVDDMAALRRILAIEATDLGCSADAAANGIEAQEMLSRNHYDILLIDMRMPVMDGWELFTNIRERYPELLGKIIFMSADYPDTRTQQLLQESNCPFLLKPFDIDELGSLICKCTGAAM
jgi:CheY-like chemotaxis protein